MSNSAETKVEEAIHVEEKEDVVDEKKEDVVDEKKEDIVDEKKEDVVDEKKEDVVDEKKEDVVEEETTEETVKEETANVHFEEDVSNKIVGLVREESIIIEEVPPLTPINNVNLKELVKLLENQFDGLDFEDSLIPQAIKISLAFVQKKNIDMDEKKAIVKTGVLTIFNKMGKPITEDLFDKTIDLIESINKNGVNKIKINKKTLKQSKDIFETAYPIFCKEVEKRYPKVDNIIVNILDMSIIIAPILNNFKNVSGAEKKILMKKILMKFINDLHIYYSDATDELKNQLRQSINGSMAFGDIIVGAINGQVSIEPAQVSGIIACLLGCFKKSS